MFATGRRVGHIASRFQVAPSYLRHSHKPSIQSHDTTQETSFTIQLIVPPSTQPERVEFSDTIALDNFVKSYQGSLRAPGPNGMTRILGPTQYKSLSPTEIYRISSPYFSAVQDERQHSQISDKSIWG